MKQLADYHKRCVRPNESMQTREVGYKTGKYQISVNYYSDIIYDEDESYL